MSYNFMDGKRVLKTDIHMYLMNIADNNFKRIINICKYLAIIVRKASVSLYLAVNTSYSETSFNSDLKSGSRNKSL